MPKMGSKGKIKITNRGAAGLLVGLKEEQRELLRAAVGDDTPTEGFDFSKWPKDRIDPSLRDLAVKISTLKPDQFNARLHPERNIDAVKQSLARYGQKKPVVVRKQTRTIVAGNGTVEAALALGWTKIAANVVAMTEIEAAGYGLADNRTAELARWDIENVSKIESLLREAKEHVVGWTEDEILLLRARSWDEQEADQTNLLESKWEIVITCTNETEQLEALEKLMKEGYTCRVLTS